MHPYMHHWVCNPQCFYNHYANSYDNSYQNNNSQVLNKLFDSNLQMLNKQNYINTINLNLSKKQKQPNNYNKKQVLQNIILLDSNQICYEWAKNGICNNKEKCRLNHGEKYNFRKINCKHGNKCILNGKLPHALGINMCCFKHEDKVIIKNDIIEKSEIINNNTIITWGITGNLDAWD